MSTARRFFLKSASMATLAAIVVGGGRLGVGQKKSRDTAREPDLGVPLEAQQQPTFMFTAGTFTPYVGGIFQAPNARGEMVELKLVGVSVYRMKPSTKITTRKTLQPDSFSLTFSSNDRLPEFTSIHRISHPALGNFDLFLTPHQLEDGTFTYEAVFSHI